MNMADQYDNTNTGVLFKNDRKEKPTQPDWNGSANIEGEEYWVNAWVKEKKADGSKFFSFSYRRKEEAPVRKAAPARRAQAMNDDIPF
jgi:hypothetical protein